jgi:hypothetical protein
MLHNKSHAYTPPQTSKLGSGYGSLERTVRAAVKPSDEPLRKGETKVPRLSVQFARRPNCGSTSSILDDRATDRTSASSSALERSIVSIPQRKVSNSGTTHRSPISTKQSLESSTNKISTNCTPKMLRRNRSSKTSARAVEMDPPDLT